MQYATKKEAVEALVNRDFNAIPQEWVQIVMDAKSLDPVPLPMWGTMWMVDSFIGKKLMDCSIQVVSPEDCENHDKDDTCDVCEDEEMLGAYNVKDKDGAGTAVYIYEIDGEYVIGVNGAGWNFYDGVWDRLYDLLGLKWHNTKCVHYQCQNEALEGSDSCQDHQYCYCKKVDGKHYFMNHKIHDKDKKGGIK